MRIATVEQVAAIADRMPSRYRALVLVAAFSGLRWGELVGLRRKRIDLEAGTVMVAEQLVEVNGTFSVGPPKSAAGRRTVLRVHDLCLPPAPGHRRRRLATRGHAPAGPRHHRGGGALPARHGRPSTVACSPSSPSSAPDQTFESKRSTARKGPGLHRNACAAGGQGLGTGSSRTLLKMPGPVRSLRLWRRWLRGPIGRRPGGLLGPGSGSGLGVATAGLRPAPRRLRGGQGQAPAAGAG
jgi:hypothetical protein